MTAAVPPPPRWTERLARVAVGRERWENSLAGDLSEEFASVARARGALGARAWYRRQVLDLLMDRTAEFSRALGSSLKSVFRPAGDPRMRSFFHELRPAARSLLRQPLSTSVIVVTLAIGLGTNAAVLGMVDALVLRPFPFQGVDELVMFSENSPENEFPQYEVAPANYFEWEAQAQSFTGMAAFTGDDLNLAGGGQAERVSATNVSTEFFALLGVTPAVGRLINEADQPRGNHQQVVLSDALWHRRFGGDPGIVGQAIRLDGEPFTVVGITPSGFEFPSGTQLWTSLGLSPEQADNRLSHYLTAIARLRPDVTFEGASAEMAAIYERQRQAFPLETRERRMVVRTFSGGMIDVGLPSVLVLWQAAALFVLLIGCANVANLLLARGADRRRELAVRVALGAGRLRLVRQLLVESLLLALVAAPLALVVAGVTFGALRGAMPEELVQYLAGWSNMGVDLRLAIVTFAAAAAAALVFGLLPAIQASRLAPNNALKEGGRSMSASRHWLRRGLVVAQLALALPLLVASGMSALGAQRFASGPQGYDPDGVLRLRLILPATGYPDTPARRLFARQLLDEARTRPGVEEVATTSVLPSSTSNQRRSLEIDGRVFDANREPPSVNYRAVSPEYLQVMRIPVLGGRGLADADRDDTEAVAVISQSMAERYWPDQPAIGARIRVDRDSTTWTTVVGVVGDTIDDWFSSRNQPTVFLPVEQVPSSLVGLVLRSSGDAALLADAARESVARVDASLAPFDVTTMNEAVHLRTTGIRFIGGMMAAFGIIALVLAAIGIYSVMACFVTERRQEIGIRMALGATTGDVLMNTAGGGGRMAAVGIGIGLGLSLLLARVIEGLLFGVVALEWWLFATIGGVLTGVAILASLVPARQAAAVDPVVTLRAD